MTRFYISKRWRRILLFTWMFPRQKVKTADRRIATPDHHLEDGIAPSPIEGPPAISLCSRCATIPWTRLLEVHGRGPVLVLQDVHESKEELQKSNCRVCRMLGSIKRFDEDNYLKWVVSADTSRFVGKLTFAQELSSSNHDAELTSPYLGIARNPISDAELTIPSRPRVDFELFKTWIEGCNEHDECVPDGATELERFKVIDCKTRTVQVAPEGCRFVALSYLWGPLEDFTNQGLPAEQTPTIEDAITATLRLGLQYIWIDRYCIEQTSAMDKHLQIKQMGQIYASAYLTIIAAAGTDPKYGLPGVSRPRQNNEIWSEQVGPVTLVQLKMPAASNLQHSRWATRAWTFQEGILSKRRLVFTEQAVLYICQTNYLHDLAADYNSGLNYELLALAEFISCARLPREIQSSAGSSRFKEALRYLTAYSRRNLTFPKDALNAVIGILNYISNDKKEPIYHLWGVPLAPILNEDGYFDTVMQKDENGNYESVPKQDLFEFALNWIHVKPCRRRSGFPSWSPLGWDGPIEYPVRYVDIIINKDFDVRTHQLNNASARPYLRHVLKHGPEIQYEDKEAISTKLEIISALVAPVQVAPDEENDFPIKLEDGTALDLEFEIYWDEDVGGNNISVKDAEDGSLDPWLVWQIGCKSVKKRRYHYVLLRLRHEGVYERAGLVVARKGRSDAGLLGASWTDPIPCKRIDSLFVA